MSVTEAPTATRLELIQVSVDGSIRDAMQAIDRGGVEICLVTDGDYRLVGIVTDGDVRRALLRAQGLEGPIAACCNRSFVAVGPEVGRADVLDLMHARTFSHVPVVDASGRLVGLHLLRELLGHHDRPNWAVIMAGGEGTRLRPLTEHVPKPMVTVAGRPILERLVLHLVGYGIRRIYLAVNYKSEVIESHFGHGDRFGCRIEYLHESEPLGTAGALSTLPEPPDHPVLVLNGDLITQANVARMLEVHESRGDLATVGVTAYCVTIPFGVVEVDAQGGLAGIREKPTEEFLVNAGIYVLAPALVAELAPGRPRSMPEILMQCRDQGRGAGVYVIREDWIDIGRHGDLNRAQGRE